MKSSPPIGEEQFEKVVQEKIQKRGAFDLNCPEDQIKTTKLFNKAYGASGCKKRASYHVSSVFILFGNATCSPETPVSEFEGACIPLRDGDVIKD